MPEITVKRPGVKDTETVNAETLKATAEDSFGGTLSVTVTLTKGTFAGGNVVTYTLSATDKVGNTKTIKVEVKVYGESGINLEYSNMASDLIKLSSKGEEFGASATDSFGEPCDVSIEAAPGFALRGGEIISLYIVATDNHVMRNLKII